MGVPIALALLAAAALPSGRPGLTPARYKALMAPISSCGVFSRRFAALPYATPLLNTLFAEGIPEQGPGENGDAFVQRIVDRLFDRIGDPSRVYVSLPIGEQARYDFARGVLIVTFPVPYEATLDSVQAGGATREVKGLFEFPPGVLPETVELKMSPADSWRFRQGGGRLQIVSLMQDYGTEQKPGADGHTDFRLVRMTPKCALISNAGTAVPGWTYDGWAAVSGE